MAINDGGPAFPRAISHTPNRDGLEFEIACAQDGMSLRDYFAAAALPAVMAARAWLAANPHPLAGDGGADMNQESIAEECYELADAMLTEREKQR